MQYEQRETMLVLLGAGASHDCIPRLHRSRGLSPDAPIRSAGLPEHPLALVRPPLTQYLADPSPLTNWALERWPLARQVIDHLQRNLDPDVSDTEEVLTLERALRLYEDEVATTPERALHLYATQFYLRDLLWACTSYMHSSDLTGGVTNYLTLIRYLLDWAGRAERCVVVVSFNYDLLFERAMESTWGFRPWKLSDYLAHHRLHLLKPHGSVQWMWPIAQEPHLDNTPESLLDLGRRSILLRTKRESTRARSSAPVVRRSSRPHRLAGVWACLHSPCRWTGRRSSAGPPPKPNASLASRAASRGF